MRFPIADGEQVAFLDAVVEERDVPVLRPLVDAAIRPTDAHDEHLPQPRVYVRRSHEHIGQIAESFRDQGLMKQDQSVSSKM